MAAFTAGPRDPMDDAKMHKELRFAQKASIVGKENVRVLAQANREIAKMSGVFARAKMDIVTKASLGKMEKELNKTTAAAGKAAIALKKAWNEGNTAQITIQTKTLKKYNDQIKTLQGNIRSVYEVNNRLGVRAEKILGSFQSRWAKVASGLTAAGFAIKTLGTLSQASRFAIGDLIAGGAQIPTATVNFKKWGMEVKGFNKAAVQGAWDWTKNLHKLGMVAVQTGEDLDTIKGLARDIQFKLHPKSAEELIMLTHQVAAVAKMMKIDLGSAMDLVVNRHRRFGESSAHTMRTLAALEHDIRQINSVWGKGTIELDEFSNMLVEISKNSSSYSQNLRTLGKIVKTHMVDMMLMGKGYRQAKDSAEALMGVIQKPPEWLHHATGLTMFDELINLDKKQLEKYYGGMPAGEQKDQMIANVLKIQERYRTGRTGQVGAARMLQEQTGETTRGIDTMLREITSRGITSTEKLRTALNLSSETVAGDLSDMLDIFQKYGSVEGYLTAERSGVIKKVLGKIQDENISKDAQRAGRLEQTFQKMLTNLISTLTGLELTDIKNVISRIQSLLDNPFITAGIAVATGLLAGAAFIVTMGLNTIALLGLTAATVASTIATIAANPISVAASTAIAGLGIGGAWLWGNSQDKETAAQKKQREQALDNAEFRARYAGGSAADIRNARFEESRRIKARNLGQAGPTPYKKGFTDPLGFLGGAGVSDFGGTGQKFQLQPGMMEMLSKFTGGGSTQELVEGIGVKLGTLFEGLKKGAEGTGTIDSSGALNMMFKLTNFLGVNAEANRLNATPTK